MKKLIYLVFAIVLGTLLTSCEKETFEPETFEPEIIESFDLAWHIANGGMDTTVRDTTYKFVQVNAEYIESGILYTYDARISTNSTEIYYGHTYIIVNAGTQIFNNGIISIIFHLYNSDGIRAYDIVLCKSGPSYEYSREDIYYVYEDFTKNIQHCRSYYANYEIAGTLTFTGEIVTEATGVYESYANEDQLK